MTDDADKKTINVSASIWYNADTDVIHMTLGGTDGEITTVNRKDGSARCHHNLFAKLARQLKTAGAPFPEGAIETLDPPRERS